MTTPTPAAPISVTQARRALRYDGTNSAYLAQQIDDFTVVTEDANQLTFTSNGQNLTVPRNGWVSYFRGQVAPEDVFANEDDFRDEYADVVQAGTHVHDLILTTGPAKPAADGEE